MTTEHTYQHKILLPWITAPKLQGGLGWSMPAAGNNSSTAIDPATGLLWADALDFLKEGNSANALAWSELVAAQRKTGGAANALTRAEAVAKQALVDRLAQVDTVLEALRGGLVVDNLRFALWNRKPSAGDSTVDLARDSYSQNTLRATPEVPVLGEPFPGSPFGGRAGKAGFRPEIRLDMAFHLNGIPLGPLEVKSEGSGQSARLEGRKQLAQDFISFAIPGLLRLQAEHETSEGRAWPGLAASSKLLTGTWRRRALNTLPLWLGKAAWRATADMSQMFLADSPWDHLMEVDAALMDQAQALRAGKPFDWAARHTQLVDKLMQMTAKLPPVLLDIPNHQRCGWDQPRAHLEALLGTIGLDQEIQLFGHPTRRKDSKEVARLELMAPRAPQRVALGQIQSWAERMYAHEDDPAWLERDLRERLSASMPGLSQEEVEQRVSERLRFRNGQEAYSVVIQGAAGVGKTNLANWVALTLHDQLETDPSGKPTSQHMFDYIVVLTDRVELRKNIADAAELSNGSKGMVSEITTAAMLAKVLAGKATRGTGRILVVNLHKFPSLLEKIKKGEATIKRGGGRIAFIIDEIHRSNQGKLNSETQEAFLEEMGELGARMGDTGKKNLIIGLTATPTDAILARFGLWRAGTGAGDPGAWTPHFSYGMQQAVEDGYVLDPMMSLMRLETVLDIDEAGTLDAAGGHIDQVADDVDQLEIYENPEYQRRTAEAVARIFLCSTVQAMRDKHHANLVGRGKAMVTMPSVKSAIGMHQAIKDALLNLANNSVGTPWERYAHIARDIANDRTFILYSNPGKRAAVAERENTGIHGECGSLNPRINGSIRTEAQIIEGFRCKDAGSDGNARNAIIVVVDKLLTGFDESTLHTLVIARNLKGVGLLQAMCRVNRTRTGKHNCLVIDASYDPAGNGLGPEAARVFHRYGGLAASRLDGLAMVDRVVEQRLDLLKHKIVARGWREWSKAVGDEARQMGAATLAANDIKESADGLALAIQIRRLVGGYLAQQAQAAPIMQLDGKDLDREFLAYLYRLHKNLKSNVPGVGRTPIQFAVRDIGVVPQEIPGEPLTQTDRQRRALTPIEELEKEREEEEGAAGKGRNLHDLQKEHDRRAALLEELRRAIQDLCIGIDEVVKGNDVLSRLREDLLEQRLDSAEASDAFRKIVASVKVRRVGNDAGEEVVWLDQVPGRREVVGWLTDPRHSHRMGLAMGAWLESTSSSL